MDEVTNVNREESVTREEIRAEDERVRHSVELSNRVHSADHESPEEIRREIERTRREMDETIDRIRHRLEFDELATDAFESAKKMWRDKNPDVMGTLKRNPGPTALTALGLGWMIFRGTTDGHTEHQFRRRMGEKASDFGHRMGARMSHMKDRVVEKADEARHRAGESGSDIGERARGKFSEAKDRTSEAFRSGVSSARESSRSSMYRARESFSESLQSNPLAMGALALAVGAACGLSLPMTQQEEQAIDKISEDVKEKASQAQSQSSSPGVEQGKTETNTGWDESI